jgi:hypothetical protein
LLQIPIEWWIKNFRIKRLGIISDVADIEKYDLKSNTWSHAASRSECPLHFGIAVVDGRIYVVGGRYGVYALLNAVTLETRHGPLFHQCLQADIL